MDNKKYYKQKYKINTPIITNKGVDYCSKGHACHTNATCLNLNTKYTCACHPGFQGDGFNCSGKFNKII